MNYSIMIAAAFILATIAVAAMSPFDHLPQGAPQQTAAAAPTSPEGDDSSDSLPSGSQDASAPSYRGHWQAGEAPQ